MSQLTAYVKQKTGRNTKLSKQLTANIVEQALKDGMSMPLELFLAVMNSEPSPRDPNETPFDYNMRRQEHWKLKMDAAKAAAPFIHPKIVTLDPGDSLDESPSDKKQLILVPIPSKTDAA